MDKIKLSSKDINYILNWRDEHPDLVRQGICPIKSVKILCYETRYVITAVRNANTIELRISQDGNGLGRLVYKILGNGMCSLLKDTTKLSDENKQSVLTVYFSTMALIVFGKDTAIPPDSVRDDYYNHTHTYSSTGKKKSSKSGYTYIMRYSNTGAPKLMIKGSHNSPNCVFSVRGHYRHLGDGRVIWISQYVKGTGKKKDKTYKIGNV